MRVTERIQEIVAEEMAEMAKKVESRVYIECYDLADEEVTEAMELQQDARVTITFPEA